MFYQNIVEDAEKLSDIEYSRAFVETFEEFVKNQAFLKADNRRAPRSFASRALMRVIKTLFEG